MSQYSSTFWKVQEVVTLAGQWIWWEGSYSTQEAAQRAIAREGSPRGARAVACRTGEGRGPIPLECG